MNDTFAKFGFQFQAKLISLFISDRDFSKQIADSLDVKLFENDSLRWIVDNSLKYFKEYKLQPTLEVFKVQISNLQEGSLLRTEVISTLREVFKSLDATDKQFVKDETVKFLRHKEYENAVVNIIPLLQQGLYEEADALFSAAGKKVQLEQDFGHEYLEDIDYRYTEEAQKKRIPTGFKVLDDIMGGGLPIGKLGIVLAPTGIGKSWMLAAFGSAALKAGYTVLHYTFELDDIYTAKRYDTILTGIPYEDLQFHQGTVKKVLSKFDGKLFIKEFPTGTLSLGGLESHIDKYIFSGIQPDLVILDYPELMKINFNSTTRDDKVLGQLYVDLRGLAGVKQFALWGADQTNRGGSGKDEIGTDDVSNAYAKMFAVDFMASISRRPKDKISNTGRMHVAKSRLGQDGVTFPMKFDTTHGSFQVFNPDSETGKKVKREMISDSQYELKYGANEYERIMNKPKQIEDGSLF